jgi:formylglycine-generating enzyme required for sulfatase activity
VNRYVVLLTIISPLAHATSHAEESQKQYTNSGGMKFALIPAGELMMGRDKSFDEVFQRTVIYAGVERAIRTEIPQHRVRVEPFYLAVTEVTQGQWENVMGTRPWSDKWGVVEGPKFPAIYVTWNDAQEFCVRLSRKEGKSYKLPKEAEWEYACRAQTNTLYSFGDESSDLEDHGWFSDNANRVGETRTLTPDLRSALGFPKRTPATTSVFVWSRNKAVSTRLRKYVHRDCGNRVDQPLCVRSIGSISRRE